MDLLQATSIIHGDCSQDPTDGIIRVNGVPLTDAQLAEVTDKAIQLEEQEKIDNAYNVLQNLCDAKSQDAKNYINGSRVTAEQLARYEEKYEISKQFKANGAYEAQLQLEADLVELSVTALADLIIAKGDAYKQALIAFNTKIEAFRVKVSNLIDAGETDKANQVLELAKDLGSSTSDDDVKALFTQVIEG